jgi:hypothetical protein
VARVRLTLEPSDPSHVFRFFRPDGTAGTVPGVRLKVFVDLSALVRRRLAAGEGAYPFCVLDTGAYLTLIPERVHRHFRPGAVTPLPFDTAMPAYLRVVTLAGGTYPYELAELVARLRDPAGGSLDVTLIAQLVHDGGQLGIPMVLGLRGGVLDGRVLHAEPDPAAPHGQGWDLRDP